MSSWPMRKPGSWGSAGGSCPTGFSIGLRSKRLKVLPSIRFQLGARPTFSRWVMHRRWVYRVSRSGPESACFWVARVKGRPARGHAARGPWALAGTGSVFGGCDSGCTGSGTVTNRAGLSPPLYALALVARGVAAVCVGAGVSVAAGRGGVAVSARCMAALGVVDSAGSPPRQPATTMIVTTTAPSGVRNLDFDTVEGVGILPVRRVGPCLRYQDGGFCQCLGSRGR